MLTQEQRHYLAAMEIDCWELRSAKKDTVVKHYIFELLDSKQYCKGILLLDAWSPSAKDEEIWKLLDAMLQAIKLHRGSNLESYSADPTKFVLMMGTESTKKTIHQSIDIEEIRQKNHSKQVATYHPVHLLLHPSDKRKAWQDLQLLL